MQPTRPPAGPAPSTSPAARPAKAPGAAGATIAKPGGARAAGAFAALLGADPRQVARAAAGPRPSEKQPPGGPAVHERAGRHGSDDREDPFGPRRAARRDRPRERDPLAPFQPLPPALLPPPGPSAPAPAVGSAAARAEAAALAERLVTSLRVGRVGKDGHELRMKLALAHGGGVEVRLRAERGTLCATLVAEPGGRAAADRLAESLAAELRDRGVTCESIEVT